MAKSLQLDPFHVSIRKSIAVDDGNGLMHDICLLMTTEVPKDHDEIIDSIRRRAVGLGWGLGATTAVVENLTEQKRIAREKAADATLVSALKHDGEDRFVDSEDKVGGTD